MDLTLFEDFLAIAITKNFSKAAAQRHVTQPAFSRRIRRLEKWAGAVLVDRGASPMQLTPAGLKFKEVAATSLAAIHKLRNEIRHEQCSDDVAVIRFAALHTLALTLFPLWIKACERRVGPIRSSLVADNLSECVASLVAGKCDFLLSYAHPEAPLELDESRFCSCHLACERLVPVSAGSHGRPIHELPGTLEVPTAYLRYAPESLLGRLTQAAMDRGPSAAIVDVRYENSMAEALKAMALQGVGVAWLPFTSVSEDLEAGDLVSASIYDWSLEMDVRIYRRRTGLSKNAERLWQSLKAE